MIIKLWGDTSDQLKTNFKQMKGIALFVVFFISLGVQMVSAQARMVSGMITNAEDGEALAGVTVVVKETTQGTITDSNGAFSLSIPEDGKVLICSFIGMESKEVVLTSSLYYPVAMYPYDFVMDEVIVTAYGKSQKIAFTGAASVVTKDELTRVQSSSVTRALEGVAAGIQIASNTGQPGADANIRIRGIGSINASSNPLIILDGAPFEGVLNSINPSDIESLSILKDAAANSLYGARGANGVILINTKKGQTGKTVVQVSTRYGINSRAIPEYDIMDDSGQYYETFWEGIRNAELGKEGVTPEDANALASSALIKDKLIYNIYDVADDQVVLHNGVLNPNANLLYYDNWGDEMFENDYRQEYNVNIRGGNEKTSVFLSLGFLEDNGYSVNSNFKRLSSRLNLEHQVYEWLKVGVNSSYITSEQNYPDPAEMAGVNMFYVSRMMAPIYPVYLRDENSNLMYDQNGKVIHDYGDDHNGTLRPFVQNGNALGAQSYDKDQWLKNVYNNHLFAKAQIIKGLSFKTSISSTNQFLHNNIYLNGKYGQYAKDGGISRKSEQKLSLINAQQLLTWDKKYGQHAFNALIGHETFTRDYNYLYASKTEFLMPDNDELAGAILDDRANSYSNEYKTKGYFSRINYSYKDQYFLSGSYRRDASSKFHPDNRWGNFWSVGFAWRIAEQNFLKDVSWIQELKYKMSYGTQGNDALLDNRGYMNYQPYLDQYEVKNINDDPALVMVYKGNKNVTWETSKSFNTGVEFALFDRKFSGEADFFSRTAADLLFNRPQPVSSGIVSYPDNVGDMNNQGIEFTMNTDLIRKKNFKWTVSLNGTHYKNEIKSLPSENGENGLTAGNYKLTEGGSIYDFYLPRYAGVEIETGKSMWYKDVKDEAGNITGEEKTTEYNDATDYIFGSAIPDLFGGISTSLYCKGFDLSVKVSYQLGGKVYDDIYRRLMHGGIETGQNFHKDMLGRWTSENTDSQIPALNANDPAINNPSDRWLTDASYLNLSNVTLGYNFLDDVLHKLNVQSARIYVVGDNLAMFSKRKGLDPRMNFNGDVGFYSSPIRTISLGLDVKF